MQEVQDAQRQTEHLEVRGLRGPLSLPEIRTGDQIGLGPDEKSHR